jgi:hypothetical protein
VQEKKHSPSLIDIFMQHTSHLLMIEPVNFGYNAETAVNNAFQQPATDDVQQKALQEFNSFVQLLRNNNIDVTVVKDTATPYTPDAIFPNNWISFHSTGELYLYPMFAHNRRQERKTTVLDAISAKFIVERTIDLTKYEAQDIFLEGTGSMVLDRVNKIAYACSSSRTDKKVLDEFCRLAGYTAVVFSATDADGVAIYHTNVMLCIGDRFAVVCLASITDAAERENVIRSLTATGKEIVDITTKQLQQFAGNMLQLINGDCELLLILSTQAYQSLTTDQINTLEKYNRLVHSPLGTIEAAGGGSARCMMAEIFLQPK